MNTKRHIAILFLICFAIYLGHNLIPHHHHSEVFSVPMSSQCPVNYDDNHYDERDHNTEKHPLHCHAFNNLVINKYSTQVFRPELRVIQSLLLRESASVPESPCLNGTSPLLSFKIPDKSVRIQGAHSLRAPPSA